MTHNRTLLALAVVAAVSGCGGRSAAPPVSGSARGGDELEGRPQQELKVELPPYPEDRDLVEFFPGPTGSHRFFIDQKSLSFGKDGIVRYAVVMRTTGGATNLAYEGIRCASGEKRTYAVGGRDKKWVEAKRSEWEPIHRGNVNEYRALLYSEYFCPNRGLLPDRDSALRALRSGRRESETRGDHL